MSEAPVITSHVGLFPKQLEFIYARERMTLMCGGAGSSKSHALVFALFTRARALGAREGLTRKIHADIANTILADWKRFIPREAYEHLVSQQVIRIRDGGEIIMFGCDDYERLGSLNLTGCACEEAPQLEEKDWEKINSLIRLPHPMGNRVYGVGNPPREGTDHWMYDYFQVDRERTNPARRYIHTTVEDGYLGQDPEYVAAMRAKTGLDRKRLYEGLWADPTGTIFDNFSEDNIRDRTVEGKIVLGIDDGDTAPFVVLEAHCDGYRLHIAREFYRKNLRSLDGKVERASAMWRPEMLGACVDMQATHVIEALWKAGIPATKSKKGANSVEAGVAKVATLLSARGPDGLPRLTVSPKCKDLIREFKTWTYQANGDYGKNNNHALDALRYLVFFFDLGASNAPQVAREEEKRETVDESESYRERHFNWEHESQLPVFGEAV